MKLWTFYYRRWDWGWQSKPARKIYVFGRRIQGEEGEDGFAVEGVKLWGPPNHLSTWRLLLERLAEGCPIYLFVQCVETVEMPTEWRGHTINVALGDNCWLVEEELPTERAMKLREQLMVEVRAVIDLLEVPDNERAAG